MSDPDHYETLQIPPTASTEEIRQAYRRRMVSVHPDKPDGDPDLARMVEQARTVLLDPVARAQYDAKRAGRDLLDEAVQALTEVGNRAVDRLSATLQSRAHDLLGTLRVKTAQAIRNRQRKR